MEVGIENPATTTPGLFDSLQALATATDVEGLPKEIRELLVLWASQINGRRVWIDIHGRGAKRDGESDERLFSLAKWRDASRFGDAERAALALTEVATRLSDRSDPVPDSLWHDAAEHFDQSALAALAALAGSTSRPTTGGAA